MSKRYNTPHRTHIIKTRVTEEEHADFMERLTAYGMSQSEFIRQAITGATVKPIIIVSPVNDELLAAVGRLTGEYGKIGGNLNQIARYLNEYGAPYNTLAAEVRAELSDLAALKFQVLREVGEAIGNTETLAIGLVFKKIARTKVCAIFCASSVCNKLLRDKLCGFSYTRAGKKTGRRLLWRVWGRTYGRCGRRRGSHRRRSLSGCT